ncbi:hypothetical protein BDL97_08G023400 [Sphagnum fallax]|nr:hypothetical protein BDL97_08G023400 [Sphagnum fallax]
MAATTTTMIQQRSVISFENRRPVAELGITRAAADAADHHHHADHHLRRQLLVVRLQVPCRNSKNHGIRGSGAVIPNRIKSRKKDSPATCYAFSSPDGEKPPRASGALESVAEAVEKATATVNDRKAQEDSAEVEETEHERDFTGTPYVPIYVMLPLGTINAENEVSEPEVLNRDLQVLKRVGVDGVMVDCWWGLVESRGPQRYNWSGYHDLFNMVRDIGLKQQVVMSFHQCGGNVGDDIVIPVPQWVLNVGFENPDIFFTDQRGTHNPECLTWGVDKERVLRGRTAIEVYYDYMRSFRTQLSEFFDDGTLTGIDIGLGPAGELRYPSYPELLGWVYPGIGEFQCYDKYLNRSLVKAAEERGHPQWGTPPKNAGHYNSRPYETGFFREKGDYDSYYGRFFLNWYSRNLIEHADRVLNLANTIFEDIKMGAKISGVHWWYKTPSHAAEVTAGFYNVNHRDGYLPIALMLAKNKAALNFTCVELRTSELARINAEALSDPEALTWQVMNSAWDAGIPVATENALPCYDREGYNRILESVKPRLNPDNCHAIFFTYLRLSPKLLEEHHLFEFMRFVRRLHGESIADLDLSDGAAVLAILELRSRGKLES